MKKNSFLIFLNALIPGFGQMYQGYMKRGASLLGWFSLFFALGVYFMISLLLLPLPLLWAYSFFDTFKLYNMSLETESNEPVIQDEFLPNPQNFSGLQKYTTRKFLGYGLIALGLLSLYNMGTNFFYWDFLEANVVVGTIVRAFPQFVISAGIVVLGIRMLLRNSAKPPKDEIVPYKGEDNDETES